MFDDTKAARNGTTNPLGKCTERLDVEVPEPVTDALTATHVITRRPKRELLREAVSDYLVGRVATMRGHSDPATQTLNDALSGLAFMAGVSRDEYINAVLYRHAFGEQALQMLALHGSREHPHESTGAIPRRL